MKLKGLENLRALASHIGVTVVILKQRLGGHAAEFKD